MRIKTVLAVITVALASLAGIILTVWLFSEADDVQSESIAEKPRKIRVAGVGESTAKKARANIAGRKRGTNAVTRVKRARRIRFEDSYSPAERQMSDRLQAALDNNELKDVREVAKTLRAQKNPDLKIEAIDALGFFGKDALSDLIPFLKDASNEVVDSASDRISSMLDELDENEKEFKADFITMMLSTKGLCNAEATDQFVGQLESIGSDDEKLAVRMIAQLIEGEQIDDRVKARAKEAYEFVTGDAYTTFEAAEKWYAEKIADEDAEKAEEQEETEGGDVTE